MTSCLTKYNHLLAFIFSLSLFPGRQIGLVCTHIKKLVTPLITHWAGRTLDLSGRLQTRH